MAKDKSKIVLCIADDRVCLCQVADQKGCAFILSSQVVQAEHFAQNNKNWLGEALKVFKPKLLKQVKDVLISTALTHYIPLEVFYLREENFNRATLLELENALGDRISQFKFGVYRTGESNIAHIFLAQQTTIAQLNALLESVGIKKARILLSSIMFIEECRQQNVATDTVFLDIGRNLVSFVFRKGAESVSRLLPIELGALSKKISGIINQNCSEEDVCQLIKSAQKQKLDQAIQGALDEFSETLHREIIRRVDQYFGGPVIWVVGGCHDHPYGIGRRLGEKIKQKIIPYHVAFKQQISPSIGADIVAAMESFVPSLLATATFAKQQSPEIINLQTDAIVVKAKAEKSFFYQNFVAGLACIVSVLLYFSQRLNCQLLSGKVYGEKLLAKQSEMAHIAEEIEGISGRIREQKKLLGNVLVYIEQNRKWCELLNELQNILAEAGNVYLTTFAWNTKAAAAKDGNVSAKEAQKTAPRKPAKATQKETKENGTESSKVFSTITMEGSMFIGNVTITEDVEREFNDKFNAMFSKIRQLSFCAELGDIKVNIPENYKITFRCAMTVNLKSKIMGL
jgi:hypothetical protein